jgi:hypothetical protein
MSVGQYAIGALFLIATVGAVGFATAHVSRCRLSHLCTESMIVAQGLIATCGFALSVLLPGMLGILTRGTQLGCTLVLAALAARVRPAALHTETVTQRVTQRNTQNRFGTVLPGLAIIVLAAWLAGELLHAGASVSRSMDTISYDLPIVGRWIQSGTVWPITELFPLQTHGTYPQGPDLILAGLILPFHNDAFIRFPVYGYLVLAAAAVYATGRELGAPRTSAALFATVFASLPAIAWDAEIGQPDTIGLAAFAAGVLFLVRRNRTRRVSDLALAGLGLGFAAGSRWYFSTAVAALVAFWILVAATRAHTGGDQSGERMLKSAVALVGIVLLTSGFWLLRNLVEAGDPFYPVRIALAGTTIFAAPPDLYRGISGFSIAHYATNPSIIGHYIIPALRRTIGLGGLLVFLGVIVAIGRSVIHARHKRRLEPRTVMLAISSVLLAIVYVVTPYSAFGLANHPSLAWVNVRYLLPAACLAASVAAAVAGALPGRARTVTEVSAVIATALGVRGAYKLLATGRTALAGGVVIVLAVTVGGVMLRRLSTDRLRFRPPARSWALGAMVTAAGLVLAGGFAVQRRLNAVRYAADDPTYAWIQAHPAPLRIGLVGSFNFGAVSPAWAMYGARIENTVMFVGRLHRGNLTQYRTRADWLAALRKGQFDLLELAIGRPPRPTTQDDVRWARQTHFPVLSRSSHFELVRARMQGAVAATRIPNRPVEDPTHSSR